MDMNANLPTFGGPDSNPYAPPKAVIAEAATPSTLAQAEPMSRARCITSLLLGIASIILSLLMLGAYAIISLMISWRFLVTARPDRLVVFFVLLGLAAIFGSLGLWLARAELRAFRSISLGAAAVRFCVGGLVGTVVGAIVLSIFMVYRWLA
jgi:uncharacterized membrane protein